MLRLIHGCHQQLGPSPLFIFKGKKAAFSFPEFQNNPLWVNKYRHGTLTSLTEEYIQTTMDRALYIAYGFSTSILPWALTFGQWLGLLQEQKHNEITCSHWKRFLWNIWADLRTEIHTVPQSGILNHKSSPHTLHMHTYTYYPSCKLKVIYILPKNFWHAASAPGASGKLCVYHVMYNWPGRLQNPEFND